LARSGGGTADSYNPTAATGMAAANGWRCRFLSCSGAVSPDGLGVEARPPNPSDYQYVIFQQGPVTITRHSLTLAVRLPLIYYSTNHALTTAPEEITAAMSLMRPWRRLNTEIALTLTLSRFIP